VTNDRYLWTKRLIDKDKNFGEV
jgi:hypothetical protein